MCSEYMCGEYDKPPHDDPWYYKIFDAIVWVIWVLYQPWKHRKKIVAVILIPILVLTWPWWGYKYYKSVIN